MKFLFWRLPTLRSHSAFLRLGWQNMMEIIAPSAQVLATGEAPKLQPEWSWRKWGGRVSEHGSSEHSLFEIKAPVAGKTHIFIDSTNDSTIGRETLHTFASINADYELHGRRGVAQALARPKMSYLSLSRRPTRTAQTRPWPWPEAHRILRRSISSVWTDKLAYVARVSCDARAAKDFPVIEFMGSKAMTARLEMRLWCLASHCCQSWSRAPQNRSSLLESCFRSLDLLMLLTRRVSQIRMPSQSKCTE